MNLSAMPIGLRVAVFVFLLFYLSNLVRMWVRAWSHSADDLLALAGRYASPWLTPLRWLENRPQSWLWWHRASVTIGLLIALAAVAVMALNLLGLFA